MNRALFLAIALLSPVFVDHAAARDITITCTLPAGGKLTLAINSNDVLQSGQPMKNPCLSC
jgi:hypothetical protein